MKDVRDIVQITTHIAGIVIIYLDSLLEKQSKENISVENVGQPYMVDIITALLVHRKRDLSKTVIGGIGEKMNNTEKLLPCPFCGGKADFKIDTNGYQKDNRSFSFHIECRNCKAVFPKRFELVFSLNKNGELEFSKDEREKAVEEWNKRV